ncbi:MAG: hypothetical protein HY912_11040 [Desulfomonile tiedjei]|uniref:Uncharacterized protein n=1 Tax=Desulfomonile tiedjei TaxID=2358 RepID=A0A9D6Z3L2_9BACT|nr:hypothetical protein [Desulfomonile tiedjei]
MRFSGSIYLPALLAGFFAFFLVSHACSASQQDCNSLRQDLEFRQTELTSYLDALGKSRNQQDSLLLGALNHKIDELISQIALLEEKMANCGESTEQTRIEGFSSVKSEEGKFATKNCGELRKTLVQLHRKVNSFKRRENSLLSDLTTAEKNELKDADQDLEKIRKILNSRCTVSPPQNSLKQRLR